MEKSHMDVSKKMNDLVDGYQTMQSRAQSIDYKKKSDIYYEDTPDFLRILDNPKYQNIVHKDPNGEPQKMMQIISKSQGWITVTPRGQNRKKPIEKQRLGKASKVNQLSPVWMQVEHEKPGPDPLKSKVVHHCVRQESNRTFLVEKV